jgi:hypothetical protein
MAYHTIRLAYVASDYLKAEIGAMCSQFDNENDYLKGVLNFVRKISSDPAGYLDGWNLLDETDLDKFAESVRITECHIENVLSTPLEERGKSPFL